MANAIVCAASTGATPANFFAVPAHVAEGRSAFELEVLAGLAATFSQPIVLTPRERALVDEAIRLHALGRVLP